MVLIDEEERDNKGPIVIVCLIVRAIAFLVPNGSSLIHMLSHMTLIAGLFYFCDGC